MEPISIYIHIPMCVKKCAYCDFTSFCGRMKQREAYTEAVCREMREQAAFFGARRVETVFFGGGTPTLMTGAQIEAVISGRNEVDCEEAAGATRVKRLRDALGNQLVSELLVKTIARRGYVLAVGKETIRMI